MTDDQPNISDLNERLQKIENYLNGGVGLMGRYKAVDDLINKEATSIMNKISMETKEDVNQQIDEKIERHHSTVFRTEFNQYKDANAKRLKMIDRQLVRIDELNDTLLTHEDTLKTMALLDDLHALRTDMEVGYAKCEDL